MECSDAFTLSWNADPDLSRKDLYKAGVATRILYFRRIKYRGFVWWWRWRRYRLIFYSGVRQGREIFREDIFGCYIVRNSSPNFGRISVWITRMWRQPDQASTTGLEEQPTKIGDWHQKLSWSSREACFRLGFDRNLVKVIIPHGNQRQAALDYKPQNIWLMSGYYLGVRSYARYILFRGEPGIFGETHYWNASNKDRRVNFNHLTSER